MAPPPAGSLRLRVHVFNTGTVKAPRGAAAKGQGWFSRVTMDVPAFVIEHPAGLVVFDTGLPPGIALEPARVMGRLNHFLAPFAMRPGADLPTQMRAAGLDPAAVRWVLLSHRHFDHTGAVRSFPAATVALARREWEAAQGLVKGDRNREPPPAERFEGLKLLLVDFSTAPAFGTFEHGVDLLGDGSILLLDAQGHTSGSMAAWVRVGPDGVLFTGDASWTDMNWRIPAVQFYAFDREMHRRRLWQIREWKRLEPRLVVLTGHDLGGLRLEPAEGVVLHE